MSQNNITSSVVATMGLEPSVGKDLEAAMISTLIECCKGLDAVAIPGFGTFTPEKSDERVVNDSEGRSFLLPPSIELKWRPSVMLKKHFVS